MVSMQSSLHPSDPEIQLVRSWLRLFDLGALKLEQKRLRTNESLHREIVAFLTMVGVSLEIDVECGKRSQVASLTMPSGKSYQQVCIQITRP